GKEFGDRILKHIGKRALEIAQKTGAIVCRSSADTFMIYSPHLSDYRRLLDYLSDFEDENEEMKSLVRFRMGVYQNADKSLEMERRFDRAKMASDSMKGNLTEPIGYYSNSMRDSELLSEQLINDFPAALKERQFVVFFQPKYDVRGDRPVLSSAEALVRWKHPELGMVSPAAFIPLFEKSGLIQHLDHYVWAEAASQIRRWKEEFDRTVPVSVNVSRVDLYDPGLVDRFIAIVRENGIRNGDLVLEITESAYIDDSEKIIEKVGILRDMGFRVEIDDFGSGYSSLSMLSYLPMDALKLDMQFVKSAFKGTKDTRLLEAMFRLARTFKVPAIAEGVETEEQYLALKSMGCDIIQGYYFSRPVPAGEFARFIKEEV
ncbi:MAG: EAL domain-containing protein, partial [Spirochaetales bacterium]|nr:EAL domain-containing protein [Spirochaetales bacterium]